MKHAYYAVLALCLPLIAPPAQAEDILSILARKAETPAQLAPTTIDYSYTVSIDIKAQKGKDLLEGQAVFRIDPSQAPGARAKVLSISDPENEALKDFLKDIEDPENTMEKRAENFWCGDNAADFEVKPNAAPELVSDPTRLTVLDENETEARIRPDPPKLAQLLMQSDENADKNGLKMAKKLMERIEGEITLDKPSGEMKGFSVRMTRPMTMMLVAKLKEMDVTQTCALAPNGHYHFSTLVMNVQGKAVGSRFGQELDIRVSDLTLLP